MPAKVYQPRTEATVSEDNFSCEAESCVIWVCGLLYYIWYVVYGTCFAGGTDFWVYCGVPRICLCGRRTVSTLGARRALIVLQCCLCSFS